MQIECEATSVAVCDVQAGVPDAPITDSDDAIKTAVETVQDDCEATTGLSDELGKEQRFWVPTGQSSWKEGR